MSRKSGNRFSDEDVRKTKESRAGERGGGKLAYGDASPAITEREDTQPAKRRRLALSDLSPQIRPRSRRPFGPTTRACNLAHQRWAVYDRTARSDRGMARICRPAADPIQKYSARPDRAGARLPGRGCGMNAPVPRILIESTWRGRLFGAQW